MESVVLTVRPMNIAVIAFMVAIILCLYYAAARGGALIKQNMAGS